MNTRIIILILLLTPVLAVAYDNDTMTTPYYLLVKARQPMNAVLLAYTETLGDWFYLLLIGSPYVMLWLHQRSMHIPTIWLTICLASYGTLIFGFAEDSTTSSYPMHIFYAMAVIWVMTILVKVFSPIYKK